MEQRRIRRVLQIGGMSCAGCEMRIENSLKKLDGVIEAKACFTSSNVYITYDANVIGLDQIIGTIEKLDYVVEKKEASDKISASLFLGIVIILPALYIIIKNTSGFDFIPEIDQSMGYGILFIVGLLTSLHCVAMCGGINLSQCISYKADNENNSKFSRFKPSLLYNSGRIVSYTVIGGIAGALGSGIGFSGAAKGIVAVISGVFMVIMGLNMLNIFPWLRKLNPGMPKIFGRKILGDKLMYGPFYVGLLNGLMPCGPLQAMQIYALGTGSFLAGALSMFMFSMGTVPLMFGIGAVSSILSGKFTQRMLKVSAVLVIVLGVVMTNRGLALSGFSIPNLPFGKGSSSEGRGIAIVDDGIQIVITKLTPGSFEPITVQKDIPVKWTINAEKSDINGCNNEIIIPKLSTAKKLEEGSNVIEFTPTETGTFEYTCWMGMIRSTITVVDEISQ